MFLFSLALNAREKRGVFRGYEGGMMLHTGYLQGSFPQVDYSASGMPVGIGGLLKIRLGDHWRVGTEGYASTLPQLKNGSYCRFGWGGLLGDFYWTFGRFAPYAGVTVGGGVNSNLLMLDGTAGSLGGGSDKADDWKPMDNAYFNRHGFVAIAPFVGCDYAVTDYFHLSLKADWLNCISPGISGGSAATRIPSGPRLYIGFIFCH